MHWQRPGAFPSSNRRPGVPIAITAARVDDVTTITISDQGPGVAAESLERIFDPFFREDAARNRKTGGTGLGLTIARNILRGHGGDVVLKNRPEGGLLAAATLPV